MLCPWIKNCGVICAQNGSLRGINKWALGWGIGRINGGGVAGEAPSPTGESVLVSRVLGASCPALGLALERGQTRTHPFPPLKLGHVPRVSVHPARACPTAIDYPNVASLFIYFK